MSPPLQTPFKTRLLAPKRRLGQFLALGLSASFALACSSTPQTTGGGGNGTVTVLGVITGEQQANLEKALAPFEEETGIEVIYEGTDTFTTLLPIRVDAGKAPDVALFPQPGLMTEFIANGQMVPITEFIAREKLAAAYPEDWVELAIFEGKVYGVWLRAAVKSLVWYNPKRFAEKGYTVPQTWEEMLALSDRIVDEGETPWCVGIQSGDATGWVATDWIEDILLRTVGPQVYDQWVAHEIPFDAEPVRTAFETFGQIAANPEYVSGGGVAALSTPVGDAILGLFTDPPRCYLHRQANFIGGFVPEGVEPGQEVAVFPLPPIDPAFGTPILVGGDLFGVFRATPEAKALVEYLITAQPHEIWAGLGGFLTPHQQVPLSVYPDDLTRQQAAILTNADVVRFDASDLMPASVGTGTFWSGAVSYVAGDDVGTVLSDIEASWPEEEK